MAEVFESVIRIETGESEQSVKGLKQEINDLRDHILNLEKGTQEYDDAVQQLQSDQRKLNEVMSLTKKDVTALDGSYDALTYKMSQLKKEWKSTNDEARRNELGKQIGEINAELKEMDASIGNFQRNVGDYANQFGNAYQKLRQEIKQYQAEVLAAEEGTEEWTAAMQRLSDAQFQMRDMNEKSRYSVADLGEQLSNISGIAAGVTAGFSAVQAVMVLTGNESEDLQKVMVKLQAAMALVQGLQGLEGLIDRVNGLGTAIKAVTKTMGKTGWIAIIMAVVTAITIAIGAIKKKREEVDHLDRSLDKLSKKNEDIIASDRERARQLEREIKLMQAQGATDEEVINKRIEHNDLYLKAAEKNYKEAQKQLNGLKDSLSMKIRGVTKEDVDKAKKIYDAANATFKEYTEKRKDLENDLKIAQIQTKKVIEENPLPELPVLGDVEIGDIDLDIDTEIKGLEDKDGQAEKSANILIGLYERQYQRKLEYNRMSLEDDETTAQREYEINLELQNKKLELLKQAQEQAWANNDVNGALELAEQIKDQELEIEMTKYDEKERLRKMDEENERQHQENLKSLMYAGMNATADILGSIADMYEADGVQSEEEAKKIKGLRIAEATINTISGAIGAFTSAAANIPAPAGIIVGAVQAAAVTAMGIANIAKIKNTDVSLGNGGSSNSPNMGGASATPSMGAYTSELPATYTRQITGASEVDELNKDQRVYILESDIQASNKRVQVRENESSF